MMEWAYVVLYVLYGLYILYKAYEIIIDNKEVETVAA